MSVAHASGLTVMKTPHDVREKVVAGRGFQHRGEASQVYRVMDSDLCLVGFSAIALGG